MTDVAEAHAYAIRERAHEIWIRLGSHNGRSLDHWIQAEQELRDGLRQESGIAGRAADQSFRDQAGEASS